MRSQFNRSCWRNTWYMHERRHIRNWMTWTRIRWPKCTRIYAVSRWWVIGACHIDLLRCIAYDCVIAHITPPTRTRQNCLVLSCLYRRCEHNCRQDKTVLSCLQLCSHVPVSNLQLFSLKYSEDYWKLGNWKLGLRDKTVLSCLRLCLHHRHRQVM